MSKKILIIILLIFVLAFLGWFIVSKKTNTQESGVDETSSGSLLGFFPFGNNSSNEEERIASPTTNDLDNNDLLGGTTNNFRLQQLTNDSTVGYIATSTGSTIKVRYMDRAKGNIHEINIETLSTKRITNTTLPAVNKMLWNKNAHDYVLRYARNDNIIKTYVGTIIDSDNATSTSDLKSLIGNFIQDDIPLAVTNTANTKILFMRVGAGGSVGLSSLFDTNTTNDDLIFSSPFSEWILSWPEENTITATTKASFITDGYFYFVDKDSGVFTKILGNIKGLTTSTNMQAETVLYSGYVDGEFQTRVHKIASGEDTQISTNTIPEKCTWSPINTDMLYCGVPTDKLGSSMPDQWYKGTASFSDQIWEINTKTNVVRLLSSPVDELRVNIDVIEPSVTSDGSYLLFKNKKDSTLWSLELEQIIEESSQITS